MHGGSIAGLRGEHWQPNILFQKVPESDPMTFFAASHATPSSRGPRVARQSDPLESSATRRTTGWPWAS
eukprot:10800448-Lingulodinium_polyedra.AAC.1